MKVEQTQSMFLIIHLVHWKEQVDYLWNYTWHYNL